MFEEFLSSFHAALIIVVTLRNPTIERNPAIPIESGRLLSLHSCIHPRKSNRIPVMFTRFRNLLLCVASCQSVVQQFMCSKLSAE